jgi:hypothetical protein
LLGFKPPSEYYLKFEPQGVYKAFVNIPMLILDPVSKKNKNFFDKILAWVLTKMKK